MLDLDLILLVLRHPSFLDNLHPVLIARHAVERRPVSIQQNIEKNKTERRPERQQSEKQRESNRNPLKPFPGNENRYIHRVDLRRAAAENDGG
jgi:hypothetical protein